MLSVNTNNLCQEALVSLDCKDGQLPTIYEYKKAEAVTLQSAMTGYFPLVVPDSFMIIAHRGASGYTADHTEESFLHAKALGAKYVEVDAQIAADGIVVLCHDEDLTQYGYKGKIESLSYDGHLSKLDMGTWRGFGVQGQYMLRLEDLFSKHGRDFAFHIELKSNQPELPKAVIELIYKHGLQEKAVLTSQWINLLEQAREVDPDIPRALLCRYLDSTAVADAKTLGCAQVCPRADLITPQIVEIVKNNGMQVRAWGVSWLTGDLAQILWRANRVIESGCIGTTINEPDLLIHSSVAAKNQHHHWPITLNMSNKSKLSVR